jgi:hypothetical protein
MSGHADAVAALTADPRVRPFNHAPAPAGLVNKAAYDGDVMALLRLLESGASTEEADDVSDTRVVSIGTVVLCCPDA